MNAAAELACIQPNSKTLPCPLFIENSPIGLAQLQAEGNITALNMTLEHMFGRERTRTASLCFADLMDPQDRKEGERLFRELFQSHRDSFQIDSKTPGEPSRPVHWTAWRIPATSLVPEFAMAVAEYTPKSTEADQHLRQAEKLEAVGRLAGGVAHDFNNLLTGVLLYCDLLLAHLEPLHRVRKYAEEIRKAGLQATGLVRQLLAVARPTQSDPRPLSLNEIAESMRNLLVRLIGENIELTFHLDPNLGLISMDPTQSQQILLNLVLNARDAMPQGGQITIETRNCKVQVLTESSLSPSVPTSLPCALFVVSDNGSGMDAATREHLFEAFFTTKAAKGTGLGLATVHEIVTRNGGLIHVDSAPSNGTRISVLLPLLTSNFPNYQDQNDFHPPISQGLHIARG